MGNALYRKYRSRSLDEVFGQAHVTDVLKTAIARDRISHAYLFTGPRGVGKTSIARILAHEINQVPYDGTTNHLDIIEIDAASNNGVDDIRDLREKVTLAPTSAKKKIYIIDEVHMLSKPAFNALLKTLEEPPSHVVFILATTDVDKLPETIISRTQRFTFKHASTKDIISNLKRIAEAETIDISDEALELIAEHSTGSYRDSVSIFDQVISNRSDAAITQLDTEAILGLAPHAQLKQLLDSLKNRNFDTSIEALTKIQQTGVQATTIALQLILAIQRSPKEYVSLLDSMNSLIEVRQSSMPDARLLAIIGSFCDTDTPTQTPKPRPVSRAAQVTTKIADIEIPELAHKATEAHPKDDIDTTPRKADKPSTSTKRKTPASTSDSLDWKSLMADTASLNIGLRSVLHKCVLENTSDTVVVYAKNEFYKKKLDTPKNRQELGDYLHQISGNEWEIKILATVPASKNQTIASVAAMMGGGEEVSVE